MKMIAPLNIFEPPLGSNTASNPKTRVPLSENKSPQKLEQLEQMYLPR